MLESSAIYDGIGNKIIQLNLNDIFFFLKYDHMIALTISEKGRLKEVTIVFFNSQKKSKNVIHPIFYFLGGHKVPPAADHEKGGSEKQKNRGTAHTHNIYISAEKARILS